MTDEELEMVQDILEDEGVMYGIMCYTDFEKGRHEVKDPEFHRLRKALIEAHDEFVAYVGVDSP